MSAPAAKAFCEPVNTMQPIFIIGVETFDGMGQLIHQRIAKRVERLGAMQGNQADGPARFHQNVFVFHGSFFADRYGRDSACGAKSNITKSALNVRRRISLLRVKVKPLPDVFPGFSRQPKLGRLVR